MSNKRLAKKGRYGDTHIRKVDGRKSHVTKREADMIDIYGLLGEILTKQQGAGTINPKTGMPEYWDWWDENIGDPLQEHVFDPIAEATGTTGMNLGEGIVHVGSGGTVDISDQGEGSIVNVDADLENIGTSDYDPSIEAGTLFDEGGDPPDIANPDPNKPFVKPDAGSTDYGAGSISASDFVDAEGNMLPYAEVVQVFMDKFPNSTQSEIEQLVAEEMPKFQKVAQKEKDLLSKQRGLDEGAAGLAKQRATDAYGLGVSAAGRGAEAATETYGLAMSGAKRGLQSGLGQLQQGAGQLGAQMRGAYGGMGGGMRGAMGAQKSLAKGLESTYGAYTDKQTAATGALGRAQGAYGDEMTRLGQAKGYVTGEGLPEGMRGAYDLSMDRAALGEERGLYGLQQGAESDYERLLSGFVDTNQFQFKKGGKVPDKQTFLDVLSKIPDAGGS